MIRGVERGLTDLGGYASMIGFCVSFGLEVQLMFVRGFRLDGPGLNLK